MSVKSSEELYFGLHAVGLCDELSVTRSLPGHSCDEGGTRTFTNPERETPEDTINSVTVSDEDMNDGQIKPSTPLPVRVSVTFHQVQHLFSVRHLSISEDQQLKREQ